MDVTISGWVYLPMDQLTELNINNMKEALTIYPRLTTDIGSQKEPSPIFLFDEDFDNNRFGVPRGYYLRTITKKHNEILDVSYGHPMSGFDTKMKMEGVYAEQATALKVMEFALENKPWGGVMLKAGCGVGKALAHGEPVLTESGYVPIENIKVGDRVAGTDGSFYPVQGVYPQGMRDIYRVNFTDRSSVDCDADHLWTLIKRRGRGKVVTLSVADMMDGRSLRYKAGRKFWLPPIVPVEFKSSVLPIDPYTLGVLLGDAGMSCNNNVILTTCEQEILDNLVLPEHNRYMPVTPSERSPSYRISADLKHAQLGKSISKILGSMGLMGKKSCDKFIPNEYMFASVRDRVALLQGLFDTDGSPISSGRIEYSTTSVALSDAVSFVVCTLGGTCSVADRETFYTKDGGKIGPFKSYRLSIKLPSEFVPFRLRRKLDGAMRGGWQRVVGRAIDSIVPVGKKEATCISVDSPDSLFLTRNCIPTHNTAMTLELARRIGKTTVILVHKDFLADQWMTRINEFMPDATIGRIKQKKCDYEGKDFVIASMQSLAKEDGDRYPSEIYNSAFGTLIIDEIHRVGSETWSSLAPMFKCAYRIGATATPRRADGCEQVFWDHISDVTYKAKSEAQDPLLRKLVTDSRLKPIQRGTYKVAASDLNSAQILTQLGRDEFRTKEIADQVVGAVQAGRKVLVLSERLEQLRSLSIMLANSFFSLDMTVGIDAYTGDWYTGERYTEKKGKHKKGELKLAKRSRDELRKAESAQVVLCTKQMASEALDIQALDVLVLATPMGDIEQAVGRVRRWCFSETEKCKRLCPWRAGKCEAKPKPIVMDVVDEGIPQLRAKWRRRERFYKKAGAI